MTTLTDTDKKKLYELHQKVETAKKELATALKEAGEMRVEDYAFTRTDGTEAKLSELFEDKTDLLVVHNMGKGCTYCTLWADGFNGLADHLADRAAFVLVSPDEPAVLGDFASGRNWRFDCASAHGTSFVSDMGYEPKPGVYMPGISSLSKNADGSIERIAHCPVGPGDMYCNLWHMFDLLPKGINGWEPKYEYA